MRVCARAEESNSGVLRRNSREAAARPGVRTAGPSCAHARHPSDPKTAVVLSTSTNYPS